MTTDEGGQPVVATWTVTFRGPQKGPWQARGPWVASVAQQAGMTIGAVLDEALGQCSFPGFTSVALCLERTGEEQA